MEHRKSGDMLAVGYVGDPNCGVVLKRRSAGSVAAPKLSES